MPETLREELDRLRSEKETPREELERLRRAQGTVNTSPFPLPERERLTPTQSAQAKIANFDLPSPTDEERALAAQGIDVSTGAPTGRTELGFAQNEAQKVASLERSLSEFYKQPVRVSVTDNGIEFINPETNRRTLVDETNMTLRDFQDIAGPSLPAAGATAGAIGGMFAGVPSLGAGVGGFAGELARRGIGSKMGVRDESADQIIRGSAGVGVTEGVLNKGGDLAMAGIQRGRNFFNEPALSSEGAERALRDMQPNLEVAEEISARTGQPFSPFTGQMSLDPVLMGHQRQALDSQFMGAKLRAQNVQNETTLEAFFDMLNPPRSAPNTVTGRAIQNEARAQTQPRVEAAKDSVEAAQRQLEEATAALPRATDTVIVRDLGTQMAESRRIMKEAEDAAWGQSRQLMGFNPETALSDVRVPLDRATFNRLSAEANAAIDPTITAGKQQLIPEGLQGDAVDLNQLQVHLSALRRRQRLARKGEVATDPQGRDITRVEANLVAQRNAHLRETNPQLLGQIEEAERLTAHRADLYDKGVAAQLLRKQGGEWTLTDQQVVRAVLESGDRESMEHLVSAMSNHPAGIPTLQKAFLQNYRNQVVEGGVPKAQLHRRFIDQNEDAMRVLFPDDRRVFQLGEFERVVAQKVKRFDNFEKAVNKSFRGRVQNLAPERVAEDVLGRGFTQKDVGRLMALADAAGVKKQYQAAITNQLRQRFMSRTSGLNLNSMGKFLDKNEDKLITAMGGRWYRDMQLLLRGMTTNRITEGGIRATRDPTLIGAMTEAGLRITVARPLSPGGVGLTRALGFRGRAAEHMIAKAIEDPKALRAIVAQANNDLRNRNVARVLAVLGGSSLAVEQFEEVPPEETGEQ